LGISAALFIFFLDSSLWGAGRGWGGIVGRGAGEWVYAMGGMPCLVYVCGRAARAACGCDVNHVSH
jgi:hypothetical protein